MSTTKKRLNITLSPELDRALKGSARKDKVPEATKAAELLKIALEIEEDNLLAKIASKRDTLDKSKYVSHEEVWKNFK